MAVKSLGTLTVDLIAKTAGFTGPLEKAERQVKKTSADMGKSLKAAAATTAAVGTAALAAATAVVAFTRSAADNAATLQRQAVVANASASEMQAWAAAATASGIGADKLSDILKDLNDRLGEFATTGSGEMSDFFTLAEQVGVTIDSFSGLSGPESLQLVVDTLDDLNLSSQQTTFILESISDEAAAVGPQLAAMAAEAAHVSDILGDMQVAITALDVQNLHDVETGFVEIETVVRATATAIGSELSPYIVELTQQLVELISGFDGTRDAVESVLEGVTDFAVATEREMRSVETVLNNLAVSSQAVATEIIKVFAAAETQVREIVNAMIEAANSLSGRFGLESLQIDLLDTTGGRINRRLEEAQANLEQLRQTSEELANRPLVTEQFRDAVEARKLFNQLTTTANLVMDQNTVALTNNAAAADKAATATQSAAKANQEQAKAQREADKAAQQLVDSYTSLLDTLFPLEASQKQYTEDLALLDAAAQQGAISTDKLTEAQKRLREQSAEGLGGFEDAPSFGGLDASVGGALGEQFKIRDAASALEEWHTAQLDQLAEFREARADLNDEWNQKELEIEAQYQQQRQQLNDATNLALLTSTEDLFSQSAEAAKAFGGEQSKLYEIMFAASKGFAIAQSLVAIQTGIANAAAIPWPANLAAMASVAAATASIISNIQAVQMVGQAHDGIMSVPQSGSWNLQKGERVLPEDTAKSMDSMMLDVQRNSTARDSEPPTVNVIEDASKAGQTDTSHINEQWVVDVWVANVTRDGKAHQAMVGKYPLKTRGR